MKEAIKKVGLKVKMCERKKDNNKVTVDGKQTPPMYNAQCAAQLNLWCCYYNGSFSNCIFKLYQIIIITILNKFVYVLNSEQISVII
jgi:hypothetical protein